MALLRGKLLAGALFAGALFNGLPQPQQTGQDAGGGRHHEPQRLVVRGVESKEYELEIRNINHEEDDEEAVVLLVLSQLITLGII